MPDRQTKVQIVPALSIDAMHLSIARDIGARVIVTADRIMVEAANLLGFQVVRFD
jgi:hypothetical protein